MSDVLMAKGGDVRLAAAFASLPDFGRRIPKGLDAGKSDDMATRDGGRRLRTIDGSVDDAAAAIRHAVLEHTG